MKQDKFLEWIETNTELQLSRELVLEKYMELSRNREYHIMKFIKNNPGKTKSKAIRYMKENKLASLETALYLINSLIEKGKINSEEINSQCHLLTIGENK